MTSTEVVRWLGAPREAVYAALVDAESIAAWKFPAGMTCEVHEFDAREGGRFRISLTYSSAEGTGKTDPRTDTYSGQFVRLHPYELVEERDEFETEDPAFVGAMTVSIALQDADGGTRVVARHDGLPAGISASDNEVGWTEALNRLAALVEGTQGSSAMSGPHRPVSG